MQLIEGELENHSDSDDEGTADEEDEEDINNTNVKQLESLDLAKVIHLSPLRNNERRGKDVVISLQIKVIT